MGKTCTELFAGIDCTILGNADDEVNGIAYRSDRVQPSWSSARCTWPTLRTSRRSW